MTLDVAALRSRAKRRLAEVTRRRGDPRYRRILGRFKSAGLLTTNFDVPENRKPIAIGDALWAGDLEPRILELLPALIVKKPSLFVDTADLPKDLAAAVQALRRNETPDTFRGIPGRDVAKWLPRVGHQGKRPTRLKCFRFTVEDLVLLRVLSREHGLSETETIRHALRSLARESR
jgi:hypothetical protein